ncbi:MAG: hypothetical protein K8S97_13425 [Anaerolineae bacterium]|nr:hypothetical protein [Anaerolineae bacterium]
MKRTTKILLGILVVVVIIIVVAVVVVNLLLDQDSTEIAQINGDLGFMTDREGHWDLFLRNLDGELLNVTAEHDKHAYFFNFTFSGEVVNFFAATDDSSTPAVVNADGSGLEILNFATALMETIQTGNVEMDPAWSPDGTQIAWTKIVPGLPFPSVKLFLGAANFSGAEELTGEGFNNNMLAWSPDGRRIVFASDRSGSSHVYVILAEGGTAQKLTDDGYDMQPVWSLDGTQIMFISERDTNLSTGQFDYYVMNADGTELHMLAEDEVFMGDPTYSPDGTQIAYMSNETGFWHIYVMDADGSNVQQVTEGETNNVFPAWRPTPVEDAAE